MSNNLNQRIIRDLLGLIYDNHPRHINYLMRRANRLQQLVFVRAFLRNERFAFIQNIEVHRANLLTALLACIEDDLEGYSERDKEIAQYALIEADISPPGLPNFLNNIFELDEW